LQKVGNATCATPRDTPDAIVGLEGDEAMTKQALNLVRAGKAKAYENRVSVSTRDIARGRAE
jgi:hypothetical protein